MGHHFNSYYLLLSTSIYVEYFDFFVYPMLDFSMDQMLIKRKWIWKRKTAPFAGTHYKESAHPLFYKYFHGMWSSNPPPLSELDLRRAHDSQTSYFQHPSRLNWKSADHFIRKFVCPHDSKELEASDFPETFI